LRNDSHVDPVLLTIVDEGNAFIVLLDAIDCDGRAGAYGSRLRHGDVVDRLSVAVVYVEGVPVRRKARANVDHIAELAQVEDNIDGTGGAGLEHDSSAHELLEAGMLAGDLVLPRVQERNGIHAALIRLNGGDLAGGDASGHYLSARNHGAGAVLDGSRNS